MTADVLVVGGGIVGCAVAVACVRRGMKVTLVERGALANGASSLDLALLGIPVPVAVEQSARRSEDAYLELHHFVGQTFLLDRSPIDCDGLPGRGVRRIDTRGAVHALVSEARSYKAEIYTSCEVKGLLMTGTVVKGARTDTGELRAGTTVVAAGAESWRVCRTLPRHVRVEPVEGLTAAYAPGSVDVERPLWNDGAWAALDSAGRLIAAEPERLLALPELLGLEPLERRLLRYVSTADGLPVHGPVPGTTGLVLACGHGLFGVAVALGGAEAVATGLAEDAWDPVLRPDRLL
jgi:glycine/D-amino acid oxidase-like deaminating enzyme